MLAARMDYKQLMKHLKTELRKRQLILKSLMMLTYITIRRLLLKVVGMLRKVTTENIEHVFIDGLNNEVTDPGDDAANMTLRRLLWRFLGMMRK